MSRVFMIQATRNLPNVAPAQVYGEMICLLTVADRTSHNPDQIRRKLTKLLENFSEEEDYILWAGGDPLSLAITGSVLDSLGVRQYKYLRYEKPDGRTGSSGYYIPVVVSNS